MPSTPTGDLFDEYYYRFGCGREYSRDEEWLTFFDRIAERINRDIHPGSVLDAGCALGFLVEGLRHHGVEAYGVDISQFAIDSVYETIKPYCWGGSVADSFPRQYDLIVSIEVLEHMEKQDAEKAVENFCLHTDDILFSSSPNDYKEITHLNVQPPEYWAELFARYGFFRDVDFDATFITAWAVRYRKSNAPIHRIVKDYERKMDRLVEENHALREINLEQRNLLASKDWSITQKDAILAEKEIQVLEQSKNLNAVQASRTFQAAHFARSMVPAGSHREKLFFKLWRGLAILRNYGLAGLFKKELWNDPRNAQG